MKKLLSMMLVLVFFNLQAQVNLTYQKPPKPILDLVDVPSAPSVRIGGNQEAMLLLYRDTYKTITGLSAKELRLAGLRINPKLFIGSRTTYYKNIKVQDLKQKNANAVQVKGLPANARLSNFRWSPDFTKVAFTNSATSGVELWVLDIKTQTAKKLTEAKLNANMGSVINWFKDSKALLVKMIASNRKSLINVATAVPTGPTISVSEGKRAQNRTYQDLLKNKADEHNFEQLALSALHKVSLDGKKELWMKGNMYRSVRFSPDGNYVMVTTVKRPFSYLVPYYRFPTNVEVYTKDAQKIATLIEHELLEDLPKGFMSVRKGKRGFSWRADKPASLYYMVALDEGDPAKKVAYRDELFALEAPFTGKGKSLMKAKNRLYRVMWGNDQLAIAYDYWWNTRNMKAYKFNPSNPAQKPTILFDRNYRDRYSDPGSFVTKRSKYNTTVLATNKNEVYLMGDGFSKKGQFPFVDKMNLKTLKKKRLYQSKFTDKLESFYAYDAKKNQLLVSIQSKNVYPNFYFRNLKNKKARQITFFENPFKAIQNVHKEVITYKRDDGIDLSGTLYLPVGYDKTKKEKMPMILWAYPVEYKNKKSASQNTKNPNRFTYPYYGSPIYWVTRGYVVLDGASFPIIGEGDTEPNDSFRKQLVANGKAAIDAVDKLGYIDRNRVAVGGHSYGAFMVANLLSHSKLFAAGIARSGAYNRTLTPFGFQSEERSYWEAPQVYYKMSPFMHADKMKTPLLLIHGEADNNSGTYPMQSKRYFNALKGLGATVRLVMLPKESHGYRAKESIMHLLWEQDQWLEKYVKNRKVSGK
ncbi:MAG TPA: S9 family peptidase [Microscillaceae bacterium]|nr:S9 family peptidase [Microscillaceae bacterium]